MNTDDIKSLDNIQDVSKKACTKIIKHREMEPNVHYKIIKAVLKKTVYGEKVMLKLDEGVLFLPPRYNCLSEKTLETVSSRKFPIIQIVNKYPNAMTNSVWEYDFKFVCI